MSICVRCAARNQDGIPFCGRCGAPLQQPTPGAGADAPRSWAAAPAQGPHPPPGNQWHGHPPAQPGPPPYETGPVPWPDGSGGFPPPGPPRENKDRTGLVIALVLVVAVVVAGGVVGFLLFGRHGSGGGSGGDGSPVANATAQSSGSSGSAGPVLADPGRVASSVPADGRVSGDVPLTGTAVGAPAAGGRTQPLAARDANCSYPASVDGAGAPVTYGPELAVDGAVGTAWRCPGSGGHTIQVAPAAGNSVVVSDLGLVPGYAKTDPASGVDRFTDNHTVTEVVWRLYDGKQWLTVRQDVADPHPQLTWIRLAKPTTVYSATVTVTATGNPGSRVDSTPVSEIAVVGTAAAGSD